MTRREKQLRKYFAAICRRLRTRHEEFTAVPVKGQFNNSCFRNAVQYVRDNPDEQCLIIECMIIDGYMPILHYVIKVGDEYREITLGWEAELYEYYIIRPIQDHDHKYIHTLFNEALDSWRDEYVPKWAQWWFHIARIV